jgi:hypothetical protein
VIKRLGVAPFGVLPVFVCLQGLSGVATTDRKVAHRFPLKATMSASESLKAFSGMADAR